MSPWLSLAWIPPPSPLTEWSQGYRLTTFSPPSSGSVKLAQDNGQPCLVPPLLLVGYNQMFRYLSIYSCFRQNIQSVDHQPLPAPIPAPDPSLLQVLRHFPTLSCTPLCHCQTAHLLQHSPHHQQHSSLC